MPLPSELVGWVQQRFSDVTRKHKAQHHNSRYQDSPPHQLCRRGGGPEEAERQQPKHELGEDDRCKRPALASPQPTRYHQESNAPATESDDQEPDRPPLVRPAQQCDQQVGGGVGNHHDALTTHEHSKQAQLRRDDDIVSSGRLVRGHGRERSARRSLWPMQRARLIVNPQATATSARARDVLINALSAVAVVEVTETKARGHAGDLAHDARLDQYDVVIALGGDGTVNEVVNGLLSEDLDGRVPALAVVPGGSTNVFARAIGLPEDHLEATGHLLEALRAGRRRRIGLGRADGRWFTFTAGLGLDAEVVDRVEKRRTKGKRSTDALYLRSAIGQYLRRTDRRDSPLTLDCPGDPVEGKQALVVVGNTSPWTFLGRLRVDPFPGASFDLGLDLLALRRLRPLATLATAAQLLTPNGRTPWGDQVVHRHDLAALAVTADHPVAFQVDGDYLGERQHVVFTSVPRALEVVV